MTKEDKVNLVLLAYKAAGAERIIADGVVGKEAVAAIQERRARQILTPDNTNRIILALKATGHNDALVADGVAGVELWKAEQDFMVINIIV